MLEVARARAQRHQWESIALVEALVEEAELPAANRYRTRGLHGRRALTTFSDRVILTFVRTCRPCWVCGRPMVSRDGGCDWTETVAAGTADIARDSPRRSRARDRALRPGYDLEASDVT